MRRPTHDRRNITMVVRTVKDGIPHEFIVDQTITDKASVKKKIREMTERHPEVVECQFVVRDEEALFRGPSLLKRAGKQSLEVYDYAVEEEDDGE